MPRLLLQLLAAGLYLSGLSLAARSTVTVWIATGTCPAIGSLLHPSETVVQYSTTDSAGSYYLTSTTEGLSTSFDTYTTTNSAGSTYVTTVSTLVPEPLTTPSVVTSVYTSTTTDASGHTIVTTGTKTITPASHTGTATSGSIPKATGRSPCPAALAEAYAADDGAEWQLICNSAFYYDDLPATNATSLADCITSCDSYVPMEDDPVYGSKGCVAVTFTDQIVSGANCFRKYSIQQVVYGTSPFDSAKLANYSLSPSISVSVVSSSAGPTGTGTTTSSSVTPTYTSYEPVMPCPIENGTYYEYPDGYSYVYYIQCGVSYLYNDLPSLITNSLESCIAACDSWVPNQGYGVSYNQPCVAVTYTTYDPNNPAFDNCYRHYAVTETRNGGDPYGNGAVRVDGVPPQSVSTGSIEPTPTPSTTATTGTGHTTSTSGTMSVSASGTSETGGTSTYSSTSSSTSLSESTSTSESTSSSESTTDSSTSTSATETPSVTPSSTDTDSTSGTSTSATETGSPTAEPCPCPQDNGQNIDVSDGSQYTLTCDQGLYNTDEPGSFFASTLDECLLSCDNYDPQTEAQGAYGAQPCVAVRYAGNAPTGSNCFRLSDGYATQEQQPQDGVCALVKNNP